MKIKYSLLAQDDTELYEAIEQAGLEDVASDILTSEHGAICSLVLENAALPDGLRKYVLAQRNIEE